MAWHVQPQVERRECWHSPSWPLHFYSVEDHDPVPLMVLLSFRMSLHTFLESAVKDPPKESLVGSESHPFDTRNQLSCTSHIAGKEEMHILLPTVCC